MSGDHRGILRPHAAPFSLSRLPPAPELAAFVEHHWLVSWDLRGRPGYLAETLPHPSIHLVIEPDGGSAVYGVHTRRWSRMLEGRGGAVGTKFRPGAFYPFTGMEAAELTDRVVPVREVFGRDADLLEDRVLAHEDDAARVREVTAFLRPRAPAPADPRLTALARIVSAMLAESADAQVSDLSARFGLSTRSLQRLFRRYVGVSPKWVLKRYRLHEAAERIAEGERDLARLALDVGYFDQAHFVKDFGALVGRSPAEYAAECDARAAA